MSNNQQRDLVIFEKYLNGQVRKVIAADHEVSAGRVGEILRNTGRMLFFTLRNAGILLNGECLYSNPRTILNHRTYWINALAKYRAYKGEKRDLTLDSPVQELGLPPKAYQALLRNNYFIVRQLVDAINARGEEFHVPNLGIQAKVHIRAVLERNGIKVNLFTREKDDVNLLLRDMLAFLEQPSTCAEEQKEKLIERIKKRL